MKLLAVLKAVSDETRLRIINLLTGRELNVNEIVEVLGMGQSRISRHLKILSDAGVLSCRKDGLWAFYTVDSGGPAERILSALTGEMGGAVYSSDNNALEAYMADRSEKGREYFNGIASRWSGIRREILGGLDLNREIVTVMKRSPVTADLGCGNGELAALLLEKSGRVIGVDRSSGMIEVARGSLAESSADNAEFRLGELSHLPLRDSEADTAVINMVLHYLDDPARGVEEACRILKKKGRLVIADLSVHNAETMRSRFGHRWLGFSDETLNSWMKQYGLKVESVKRFRTENGLEPFIYVCTKN